MKSVSSLLGADISSRLLLDAVSLAVCNIQFVGGQEFVMHIAQGSGALNSLGFRRIYSPVPTAPTFIRFTTIFHIAQQYHLCTYILHTCTCTLHTAYIHTHCIYAAYNTHCIQHTYIHTAYCIHKKSLTSLVASPVLHVLTPAARIYMRIYIQEKGRVNPALI